MYSQKDLQFPNAVPAFPIFNLIWSMLEGERHTHKYNTVISKFMDAKLMWIALSVKLTSEKTTNLLYLQKLHEFCLVG